LTTETDPIFSASAAAGITGTNISNWNTAYGWGDHSAEGYITLTDLSSSATGITYTNTTGVFSLTSGYVIPTTTEETNWNTAYTNRVDTWNYPLSISSNAVSFGYNTTNLQLTANQLNTIQNINSTATPTFHSLTLGYEGADGTLTLYSEQGTTDYSKFFNPELKLKILPTRFQITMGVLIRS
jgi:hypothetical protein